MNTAFLAAPLRKIFDHYHASNQRYRHLAFSSKDFALLPDITITIKSCLPNYQVWDGNQPIAQSPSVDCSRFDFIQKTFAQPEGLIIVQPDYWFRHWSLLDVQAFWSALSTRSGGQNVIVVFAQSNEFSHINQHYFLPSELQGTAITLWVSSKAPLSSQDG